VRVLKLQLPLTQVISNAHRRTLNEKHFNGEGNRKHSELTARDARRPCRYHPVLASKHNAEPGRKQVRTTDSLACFFPASFPEVRRLLWKRVGLLSRCPSQTSNRSRLHHHEFAAEAICCAENLVRRARTYPRRTASADEAVSSATSSSEVMPLARCSTSTSSSSATVLSWEHAKLWGAGVIEWVPRRWNGSELMT